MRITSKGQVTIPIEIREKARLLPGEEVDFVVEGDSVRIVRAAPRAGQSRGERLVRHLRGRATALRLTSDEILALTRGE